MKALFNLIKLDLKLLVKHNLLSVSVFIALIYISLFRIFDLGDYTPLVSAIIFSDPVMIGFIFIGVIVLYDKSQNTLQVFSVCPFKFENYIWSKAISLTLLSLPICFGIAISAKGLNFNPFSLLLATAASSILFTLLGFIGVSKVKSFNQYIMIIPLFFAPAIIPMLDLFNIWNHKILYILPTHASLKLFTASFHSISLFDWIYSVLYLLTWIMVARLFAIKVYKNSLAHL